jgi:hypothetical protein
MRRSLADYCAAAYTFGATGWAPNCRRQVKSWLVLRS